MLGVDWYKDGAESDRVYLADQCLPNRVQASLIQGADFVTVEFESYLHYGTWRGRDGESIRPFVCSVSQSR